jgi:hypothetical protein
VARCWLARGRESAGTRRPPSSQYGRLWPRPAEQEPHVSGHQLIIRPLPWGETCLSRPRACRRPPRNQGLPRLPGSQNAASTRIPQDAPPRARGLPPSPSRSCRRGHP